MNIFQVPNTIEFADWIGRTKQKKIRVTGQVSITLIIELCNCFTCCNSFLYQPLILSTSSPCFFCDTWKIILLGFLLRTIKRPVPLEHCLFFSGGLFKICENDEFLPQGFKAVKEVYKKRKSNAVGGPSGVKHVASHFHGGGQPKQFDRSNRERSQKHSGHQNAQNSLNTSGNQHTSGLRRSESSLWLSLINKLSKNAQLPVRSLLFKSRDSFFY